MLICAEQDEPPDDRWRPRAATAAGLWRLRGENKTRGFGKELKKMAILKSVCARSPRPGDKVYTTAGGMMPAVFHQYMHEAVKHKLNQLGFEEEAKATEE